MSATEMLDSLLFDEIPSAVSEHPLAPADGKNDTARSANSEPVLMSTSVSTRAARPR